MNLHKRSSSVATASIALSVCACLAGCKSSAPTASDASLSTQVQSRLSSDQSLSGSSIQPSVAAGVVTLNGSVATDTERSIAIGDASQVPGVQKVINNLVLQSQPVTAGTSAPTAPAPAAAPILQPSPTHPSKPVKPSAAIAQYPVPPQSAPIERDNPAPPPPPQPVAQVQQPPPPPVAHDITLPAGTTIPVRITQTLDSATSQTGDKFTGVVASDLIVDGLVVLPQGTDVTGHVDAVQDAAHFKGSSLLTISLSSISHHGQRIDVATEAYTKQGEGRGKNTAEKVGGGAAVGAILGGIFGGGKGAAIGAAAGGGVGAGANTVTRGQQVQIPSESVVRFKLSDGIMVHVAGGSRPDGSGQPLERRNDQ